MADADWIRTGISAAISLVSGIGGLMLGVYRAGRKSAEGEQSLRDEMRNDMTSLERATTAARDLLAEQFKEAFNGIRRQIDDHRLHTEEKFVRKDDFKEFRDEYRDDMRDLKAAISNISRDR